MSFICSQIYPWSEFVVRSWLRICALTAWGQVTSPKNLLQTVSSLFILLFLFAITKLFARCWRECLRSNTRNSFVFTWRVYLSTNNGYSSLDLNSSLLLTSDVKALNWNYLSFIFIEICLPVSFFLAFTLKTIEVIRSNITLLERCLRGADFKCVWVIVPI